jgi:hypothetical protein
MDANFKLKGKDRKITDLEWSTGWSYCVNEHKYQEHLANYADEAEVRIFFLLREDGSESIR